MASADISSPLSSGKSAIKVSYVYALVAGNEEAVKIGRADDPEKRFRQLQTGHPQVLRQDALKRIALPLALGPSATS